MTEKKRILAMAIGPSRDLSISPNIADGDVRPYIQGLVEGLAKYGHQVGTDYEIDYRERPTLDPKDKGLSEAFGNGSHNLIFGMSTTVVRAAKAAVPSVPIVGVVSDRKAEGLGKAKITGISARRSQTAGECLQHFVATVPTLRVVHVLHKKGYGPSERGLKLVKAAAKKRGVAVKPVAIKTAEDALKKIAAMPKRDPKKPAVAGLLVLPVDSCLGAARQIIEAAQGSKNIPAFFPVTDFVTPKSSSALGGHGVPQRQCGIMMAEYVEKILWHGADPGSLKVKEADDDMFEWVVSEAAAKSLNIKLPQVL